TRRSSDLYAAGTPVVASRVGALAELVNEDENGYLVPLGCVRDWSNAVARFSDPGLAARLRSGAFSTWRDLYSPRRALEDLEAAYADARAVAAPRLGRPEL